MTLTTTLVRLLLASLFLFSIQAVAQVYQGHVVNAETLEPLQGVSITWGDDKQATTTSDAKGRFTIPHRRFRVVRFESMGYDPSDFRPVDLPKDGLIRMFPRSETLDEVTVVARENPAWRIVRNAIRHKSVNDPNQYDSYRYVSYNKNVITYNFNLDSTLSESERAEILADAERAERKHLLVIESVTRKFFRQPNRHAEEVIGTKISGFENPNVATVPDGIQHFGFYDNYFRLLNKEYLSPLARGFESRYVFLMRDTIIRGNDSTFVMDYFPTRGANFEGFEGELHINSKGWAIEYVTAVPWDKGKISLSMEQRYTRVFGGYWFPSELHFTLELERFPLRKNGAVMMGYTYLDSVYVNVPVPEEAFDHVAVKVRENAGLVDDTFWEERRTADLDVKELTTIQYMDSLGERYHLGAAMRSTRHLYRGFLAMDAINLDLTRLIAQNQYEGIRLGVGLYTNERIASWFSTGGYFGYGLNDKAIKYGGELKLIFDRKNDFWMRYRYRNDVLGPGKTSINYWTRTSFAEQFYNVLMDRIEEHQVMLHSRAFTFHIFEAGARKFSLEPTYDYGFIGNDGEVSQRFHFSEIQLGWRWVHQEKIIANYGQPISTGSKWPAVRLNYNRGISGVLDSDFDYNKVELGIQWDYFTPNLGRTLVGLEGGYVDRALPFGLNFGARPSYSPSFSFVVPNSFQVMRFNEFSNSQYAALYFMHDFRSLLFRAGWFKPEFRLFQGVAFGRLDHADRHVNLSATDMRHGYYESGVSIDNILRFNIMNAGYFGVGAGVFYRYGPYELPDIADNFAVKLAFMYSIN